MRITSMGNHGVAGGISERGILVVLVYVRVQSLQCCTQYHVILDHVIMAPECVFV